MPVTETGPDVGLKKVESLKEPSKVIGPMVGDADRLAPPMMTFPSCGRNTVAKVVFAVVNGLIGVKRVNTDEVLPSTALVAFWSPEATRSWNPRVAPSRGMAAMGRFAWAPVRKDAIGA